MMSINQFTPHPESPLDGILLVVIAVPMCMSGKIDLSQITLGKRCLD